MTHSAAPALKLLASNSTRATIEEALAPAYARATGRTVEQHYEAHLAPVYQWMAGGWDAALVRGESDIDDVMPEELAGRMAVDLGAGIGMHAIPLARRGCKVLAVDTSAELLRTLRLHGKGLPIRTVQADMRSLQSLVKAPAGSKTLPPPPATALPKYREAEKLYRVISQTDNEYTTRATKRRMTCVRRLLGEADRPPASYKTFEEAQMASLIQISKLFDEEKADRPEDEEAAKKYDAGLKDRRLRIVALLEHAREIATDKDAPAAMTIATSASIGSVLTILKGGQFPHLTVDDVAVAPMPGPGSPGTLVGGASLWINDSGDPARVAAAWKYLEFMTAAQQQATWAATTGYVALRADYASYTSSSSHAPDVWPTPVNDRPGRWRLASRTVPSTGSFELRWLEALPAALGAAIFQVEPDDARNRRQLRATGLGEVCPSKIEDHRHCDRLQPVAAVCGERSVGIELAGIQPDDIDRRRICALWIRHGIPIQGRRFPGQRLDRGAHNASAIGDVEERELVRRMPRVEQCVGEGGGEHGLAGAGEPGHAEPHMRGLRFFAEEAHRIPHRAGGGIEPPHRFGFGHGCPRAAGATLPTGRRTRKPGRRIAPRATVAPNGTL